MLIIFVRLPLKKESTKRAMDPPFGQRFPFLLDIVILRFSVLNPTPYPKKVEKKKHCEFFTLSLIII